MDRFYSFILIILITAVSCHEKISSPPRGDEQREQRSKIANSPAGSEEGSLLIKLKENHEITDLIPVLESYSCVAERVFAVIPGKEEIERKYGFDKWYKISFGEEKGKESIARLMETNDAIESVEYLSYLKRDSELSQPCRQIDLSSQVLKGMNDPLLDKQWYLVNNGSKSDFGQYAAQGADVNIKDAWRLCAGDPSIIVAVVDEGIKYTHPDLAANMWINTKEKNGVEGVDDDNNGYVDDIYGYNFYSRSGNIDWKTAGGANPGHGTHVAGLVAAVNNNSEGISSVAGGNGKGDGVRLMSCQVFQGSKNGTVETFANAVRYAADNGASVLQCSLGSFGSSLAITSDEMYERGAATQIELAALKYFLDPGQSNKYNSSVITDGNIVVFSAGNDGSTQVSYPGAYRDFICVAATGQDGRPAFYTNYGYGVNISAPGGNSKLGGITMLSTVPSELYRGQDYGFIQGTSQATPLVSGIVSLGLSYAKKLGKKFTRDEFISMVLTSTDEIDSNLNGIAPGTGKPLEAYKGKMGTGIINAWKLLMQIEGTPCAVVKKGDATKISLSDRFGGESSKITYLEVTVDPASKEALGIEETPVVEKGSLLVKCTKTGSGKITVNAIGGSDRLGGPETGGMKISKEIAIISKAETSANGGWL